MGVVYKAEDRLFQNRPVAVKEMNQHGLSPRELIEAIEAFEREAYLLVDLSHPSLPKIQVLIRGQFSWHPRDLTGL